MLLLEHLNNINLHPETYLDNKLNDILIYNEININELNNCICCIRHTNNIIAYNKNNCKCPCRHFKRILENKIKERNLN
jgi:hypothetical protein